MSSKIKSPLHPVQYLLAWPAWLRVVAVTPVVAVLWLAVVWANLEAAPW